MSTQAQELDEMLREYLENSARMTRDEYVAAKKTDWAEIGADLKEQRLQYGLTLTEMARETGFSASTLSNFEKGRPVQRANVIESSYRLLFRLKSTEEIAHMTFDQLTGSEYTLRFAGSDELDASEIDGGCVAGLNVYQDDPAQPVNYDNVVPLFEY